MNVSGAGWTACADAATLDAGLEGPAIWRLDQVMRRYGLIMTQDFGQIVTRTGDFELTDESRTKFRALKRQIDLTVRSIVQQGIDDGSIKGDDARIITFTITGALNWIGLWYKPDGEITAQEAVNTTVATLLDGLRP